MDMETWALIWKIVFIGGVSLFFGMAIWVTIGGYKDIKKLFKKIDESHRESE